MINLHRSRAHSTAINYRTFGAHPPLKLITSYRKSDYGHLIKLIIPAHYDKRNPRTNLMLISCDEGTLSIKKDPSNLRNKFSIGLKGRRLRKSHCTPESPSCSALREPNTKFRLRFHFFSENPEEEDHESKKLPSKVEKRNRKVISPVFQMEPQMIRVKDTISPASHLHSEKIRVSFLRSTLLVFFFFPPTFVTFFSFLLPPVLFC